MNLTAALEVAVGRTPNRAALVQGTKRLTFQELWDRSLRSAGVLAAAGFKRGDRVALLLSNCFEFAEIGVGTIGAGGVLVLVNTRLAAPEVSYVINNSEARFLFVGSEFLPIVDAIRNDLPAGIIIFVVGATSGTDELRCYDSAFVSAPSASSFTEVAPTDDCLIVYTSGTTGRSKGAVRTHGNCIANAHSMTVVENCGPEDSLIVAIPLASAGFFNLFFPSAMRSLTIHLMKKFDPIEFLQLVSEQRSTHTYLVPSMWNMVLNASRNEEFDTSSLRCGIWGGEPMSESLRQRVVARFGNILAGLWGATECGLSISRPEDGASRPGTAGRASGLNLLRVVDDDGVEVTRGQPGELINKGASIMSRYLGNPEATASAIRDGWYYSGDIATMDDDGYLFIIDRKREMLISGGQNVYPAEIETALMEYPGIARASVVGVPDAKWGEVPVAFIVGLDNSQGEDLAKWCRNRLAGYKIPRFWHFVEDLPMNANGKILKNTLREEARARLAARLAEGK